MREHGLGEGRIFRSIKEMAPNVDVIAIFGPNFTRLEVVEEIVEAVKAGAPIKGVISARSRWDAIWLSAAADGHDRRAKLSNAYFENQIYMKSVRCSPRAASPRDRGDGAAAVDAVGRRTRRPT